jgi:hypothetical protein
VLEGTLLVSGVPADSGTVVLHRVTAVEAGPLDSVKVSAGGQFSFPLPVTPGVDGTLYFVTHRLDEVVHFGAPVGDLSALAAPYELKASRMQVLEPGGGSFRISVRNLFIEEGPDGWRVTDVFEVGHDDPHTWRSPDPEGGVPVWSYPLPEGARNIQAPETDVAPEALRLDRGALEVLAPFPPGDRLFVVRYDLSTIEVTIPMPGRTGLVELLVREPAPELRVSGLQQDLPIEIERGSTYRRWWAEDVMNAAPTLRLGGEPKPFTAWVATLLSLLLIVLGSWIIRGRAPRGLAGMAEGAMSAPAKRRSLVLRIAQLDEAVAQGTLTAEEGAAQRAQLLAELESM